MPLVQLEGISHAFNGKVALDNASLRVRAGEIVTLIGPNGAGKSTLVRVVLGLLKPQQGKVQRKARLCIGYMPQKLQLDASLPLSVLGFLRLLPGISAEKACAALHEVGAASVINSPLHSLSGGELQRVLLARALLREPQLLVLDEPVQGVDINGQAELYRLISQLRDRYQCGVLMVSHDLHLVMHSTDWVVCLNRHICCSGHPAQIVKDAAYTQLFGELAAYPHHHNHQHDLSGQVIEITGERRAGERASP